MRDAPQKREGADLSIGDEACAMLCEEEGRKLDEERKAGHPALKDERRARAESAYYCAHLIREAHKSVRTARGAKEPKEQT